MADETGSPERAAVAAALAMLARRDFSEATLRKRLTQRGHDPGAVSAAVRRCRELRYLDDRGYGLTRAGAVIERKPSGRRALVQDLQRQGLTPTMSAEVAGEALERVGGEGTVLADALERWRARYGDPDDWGRAKRCHDHLLRRGFPTASVRGALSTWLDELGK